MNSFWAEQMVMNKILKFREHLKFSHPLQFDLIKANLRRKSKEQSVPEIKTEEIIRNDSKYLDLQEEVDKSQSRVNDKPNKQNHLYKWKIRLRLILQII